MKAHSFIVQSFSSMQCSGPTAAAAATVAATVTAATATTIAAAIATATTATATTTVAAAAAAEILWLMFHDLCAEILKDRLEFVISPDVTLSG